LVVFALKKYSDVAGALMHMWHVILGSKIRFFNNTYEIFIKTYTLLAAGCYWKKA